MSIYHTAGDRTPFTYLVKFKSTGQLYYGCRYGKNCHPNNLWDTYFTSSKIINNLVSQHGKDSFEYEIRKIFDSVENCKLWEERVLKKFGSRKDFLNRERQSMDDKSSIEEDFATFKSLRIKDLYWVYDEKENKSLGFCRLKPNDGIFYDKRYLIKDVILSQEHIERLGVWVNS